MMRKPAITFATIVLLLGGGWAGAALGKEEIDFQVMVVPDGADNVVTTYWPGTRAATCLSKTHIGCYDVPSGEEAEIRVNLTNGDDSCAREESWRLKDVVLGGEGDVDNPPDKPGKDGWGNISAQAAKDFSADPVSGAVKAVSKASTITFQNLNTAAYSIWYKVRVESCATDRSGGRTIIEFDPRIDNRGRPSS